MQHIPSVVAPARIVVPGSGMSRPRRILPGQFWLVTRRCTQRLFLLRPDARTTQIYLYCLALAAAKTGVRVLAFVAMSNHHHLVVYDPDARLPEFYEHLHKLLAKALNHRWSRWENFWSSEPTCATLLVEPHDVIRKIVYTLANPVREHLVDLARHWPGATSLGLTMGRGSMRIARPKGFFRDNGPTPEVAELTVDIPDGFADRAEWADYLSQELAAIEQAAALERQASGKRIVGRSAVSRVSAFDAPTTSPPRRTLRPWVAAKRTEARIAALDALKAFWAQYREALAALARRAKRLLFPDGTYRWRHLGFRCVDNAPKT
jgi:putative transposase